MHYILLAKSFERDKDRRVESFKFQENRIKSNDMRIQVKDYLMSSILRPSDIYLIIVFYLCRIVNYEGLKKQKNADKDHWEKYCPTSVDNLLLGTTWLYFYKDFIGLRRGLFIVPIVKF